MEEIDTERDAKDLILAIKASRNPAETAELLGYAVAYFHALYVALYPEHDLHVKICKFAEIVEEQARLYLEDTSELLSMVPQ